MCQGRSAETSSVEVDSASPGMSGSFEFLKCSDCVLCRSIGLKGSMHDLPQGSLLLGLGIVQSTPSVVKTRSSHDLMQAERYRCAGILCSLCNHVRWKEAERSY